MTKRGQKTIIHATSVVTNDAVEAALWEQLYDMNGADSIARILAARLRDPMPAPTLLAMVARWLDPEGDDCFELVVQRRRGGKSWTKRVNDAAYAETVKLHKQGLGNKHGSLRKAVERVADHYGVSPATVRKALRAK